MGSKRSIRAWMATIAAPLGQRRRTVAFLIALVLVVLLPLSVFVWPTIYRYDHANFGKGVVPVRVNRVTGETQILSEEGWRTVQADDENKGRLPTEAVAKLEGHFEFGYDGAYESIGRINCEVFNGSDWTVDELIVNVSVRNSRQQLVRDRQVVMHLIHGTGASGTSSYYGSSCYFGNEAKKTAETNVIIVAAEGHRE